MGVRRVSGPLIALLTDVEETVKWKAVEALGDAVDRLARSDIEAARVVMRRLMWNLNDESGGIGWGMPEAMGEIMARNGVLADEYGLILVSYLREDGNFLEMEGLQCGVLWGLHRLSRFRPDIASASIPYVRPFLRSGNASLRGHAALLVLSTGLGPTYPEMSGLREDESHFTFYHDGVVRGMRIAGVFQAARR